MNKRVIIKVNGGKEIGYGHYFRCLSLANMINRESISECVDILFIINKDLEAIILNENYEYYLSKNIEDDIALLKTIEVDLFILDSYKYNDDYLYKIKENLNGKLMLIDDNNDIYNTSIIDVLYNGNIHAKELNYTKKEGQKQFIGIEYLIMKEEYLNIDDEIKSESGRGILLTTGGSDTFNISIDILNDLLKKYDEKITVIIGPGYEEDYIRILEEVKIQNKNVSLVYKPRSLKKYIIENEYIISAGGSTVYEILKLNKKLVIFSIADNQDTICERLIDLGILYLGKYPKIDLYKLKNLEGTKKIDMEIGNKSNFMVQSILKYI